MRAAQLDGHAAAEDGRDVRERLAEHREPKVDEGAPAGVLLPEEDVLEVRVLVQQRERRPVHLEREVVVQGQHAEGPELQPEIPEGVQHAEREPRWPGGVAPSPDQKDLPPRHTERPRDGAELRIG